MFITFQWGSDTYIEVILPPPPPHRIICNVESYICNCLYTAPIKYDAVSNLQSHFKNGHTDRRVTHI